MTTPDSQIVELLALSDEMPELEELRPYLAAEAPAVRRTALAVLTESAPPGAGPVLVGALLDPDPEVRHAALDGLLELRELLEADDDLRIALEDAVAAGDPAARAVAVQLQREHRFGSESSFAQSLDDPDPGVRKQAVSGLVALESWDTIASARADGEPTVRLTVVRALATLAVPESAPALLELAGDADGRVRAAALEAFAAVGCPPDLAACAIEATTEPAWELRKGAATGMRTGPAEMVVQPLLGLLADANLDVRKAAVQSLSAWVGSIPEVGAALATVLDDPDADVRAYARMALA